VKYKEIVTGVLPTLRHILGFQTGTSSQRQFC